MWIETMTRKQAARRGREQAVHGSGVLLFYHEGDGMNRVEMFVPHDASFRTLTGHVVDRAPDDE